MFRLRLIVAFAMVAHVAAGAHAAQGAELAGVGALPHVPRLQTSPFSVSGLSSGAAMAVQLGVAHAERVDGVGILAGPPYLCADGSLMRAYNTCLLLGAAQWSKWTNWFDGVGLGSPASACESRPGAKLDIKTIIDDTRSLAREGRIDAPEHIARQRVWEFRGRCDAVVGSNASQAQADFYRHFGAAFVAGTRDGTGHTLPTDRPGLGPCNAKDEDYVSSCGFDAVGDMLRFVARVPGAARSAAVGRWVRFDQSYYVDGDGDAARRLRDVSLAREAEVFVPERCTRDACKVHVVLHGCLQGIEDATYRTFLRQSGYAEWASSLGLVVLFPRVTAVKAFERGVDPVGNPAGCWDWWGYTNSRFGSARRYATREAPQIQAIMRMVDALAAP